MSRELRVISNIRKPRQPKPDWLKIRLGDPTNQNHVLKLIEGLNLHTVCQEARCPNIFECWSDRTATFMLGRRHLHAALWLLRGRQRRAGLA